MEFARPAQTQAGWPSLALAEARLGKPVQLETRLDLRGWPAPGFAPSHTPAAPLVAVALPAIRRGPAPVAVAPVAAALAAVALAAVAGGAQLHLQTREVTQGWPSAPRRLAPHLCWALVLGA